MSTITIKEVGFKDGGYNNQDLNIRLKQQFAVSLFRDRQAGRSNATTSQESGGFKSKRKIKTQHTVNTTTSNKHHDNLADAIGPIALHV